MEQGIKQCRGHISTIRTNEKQTKSELAEFVARPLLSELHCDIERLKKEKEGILVDLAKFGEGELNAASPEEKTAIEKEWKYWQKQVNVRKQICHDMWRRCSEVLPEGMTPEELKVHTRPMRPRTDVGKLIMDDDRNLWALKGL